MTALLRYMPTDYSRVVPTADAEASGPRMFLELAERILFTKVDSWLGINKNLLGKHEAHLPALFRASPAYREKCDEVAAKEYEGFLLQCGGPA